MKNMKGIGKLATIFLLIVCLLSGIAAGEGMGNGFGTPEEAVLCFLAGLQEQKLGTMLKAFYPEMESRTTLRNAALAYGSYFDASWPAFPSDGGILSAINDMLLLGDRATVLSESMLLYTYPEVAPETSVNHLRSASIRNVEDANVLLSSFDLESLSKLNGISDIRIVSADEATEGSYSNRTRTKRLEGLRVRYGADEVKELAAFFTVNGCEYVFAPLMGRYGDCWYMIAPYGILYAILGIEPGNTGVFRLLGKADTVTETATIPKQSAVSICPAEVGGETPEEAVRLYLEGLKTGDSDMMLSAYAWESMNRNADFTASALFRVLYDKNSWPLFPHDGGLLDDLNMALLVERRVDKLRGSFLYFVTEGKLNDNENMKRTRRIPVRNDEDADALLSYFELNRMCLLETISDISFCEPQELSDVYGSDAVKRTRESYRQAYGADELTELAVFFTIDGEEYVIMPQLVRYGDRWYISDMTGTLSVICGIKAENAALCPVSLGEYGK